ncbi:MAG: bifunctional (p)ppGpp synthetase/guanosine-3',5'-bis(diphosphate) 3'-pyrophosphohydrolase [Deltaproteobacteria bacterium]|nr:bifunctional (p)ppGpp synthetase/guanosine-3',5'-bis(diphosphate) 3'-pyrophosphohydrolase [Deltaproteobacteria bacterium]
MLRFNDIADQIESYNPSADLDLLEKAYVFSAKVHQGQVRRSGEPYLIHPLEVAGILTKMKLDVAAVATGLLHDTIEDTLTTFEEIKEHFGDEIAHLVDGVTKISQINFQTREEQQAENFRKMVLAMVKDIKVILIKLADRLHNMRTLHYLDSQKQREIAQETIEIFAPIANRLGIDWIKTELEELAFRYLEPQACRELSKKVAKTKKERERYVDEVKGIITKKLDELGIRGEVTGRVKQLFSIYKKMKRQGVEFHDVYDITAFRIIVGSIKECYEALGIIHSLWPPVPGKFDDYIALPKGNMYQSLHTTVIGPYGERIEIQIRTWEIHMIAEEGIAAHWKYKESGKFDEKDAKRFSWLRQLLEWQMDLEDSQEFLQTVKVDLFPTEVYVFTPNGEVKEFPKGATPVDFAYSIHTDVGHQCVRAKVNSRLVPLNYQLKNGDAVEIITSAKHHPSRDWLKFVKTPRAKTKILQWIKGQQREKSISLGRDLCERDFKKFGLKYSKYWKAGDFEKTAQEFSLTNGEELLASIGYGKITTQQVIGRLAPEKIRIDDKKTAEGGLEKVIKRISSRQKGLVKIDGIDDVLMSFAGCCNPLPGDKIVGFITRGRGVTIHTADCLNALAADPRRRIEAQWALDGDTTFPTRIRIYSADKKGMLATMSSSISGNGVNIIGAQIRTTGDGNAESTFDIEIGNLKQLKKILHALQNIDGVMKVERIREWQGPVGP